jgi:hypothetical protein
VAKLAEVFEPHSFFRAAALSIPLRIAPELRAGAISREIAWAWVIQS